MMDRDDRSSRDRIDNPFAARAAAPAVRPEVRMEARPQTRPEAPSTSPRAASSARAATAPLGLRSMTGFEEEVVERLAGDPNTARLCNEIVARCLVPPGEDHRAARALVHAMTVAERDVALVTVRRLSFGDAVEADVSCPACRASNAVDFALSDLPLDLGLLAPGPGPAAGPRELEVELPDGTTARLRLPTAGDQEALLDEALETAAERRTWIIARALLRLGEREGPFDDGFARALPTATRRALEAGLEAALPALDLSMQVTCAACGHAFTEPFDVSGFFLPS